MVAYDLRDSKSKYSKLMGQNGIFFVGQSLTKFSSDPLRKEEKKKPNSTPNYFLKKDLKT